MVVLIRSVAHGGRGKLIQHDLAKFWVAFQCSPLIPSIILAQHPPNGLISAQFALMEQLSSISARNRREIRPKGFICAL